MAKYLKNTMPILLIGLLWVCPILVQAQNEISRERSSLKGLQAVGFTVNYEANAPLAKEDEISINSFQEMGKKILQEAKIPLVPDEKIKDSGQVPVLRMHVNAMDAGRGLTPFAISLHLYQPVKLALNRDIQTSASTWESSTLGIASYDQLHLIIDADRGLLKEFADDFNDVNNSNF